MNTINTNNSILNATNYKQANAAVNTINNKNTMQTDSFVKSANSLIPEPYTKEDSRSIAQTTSISTVPDIDLNALTEDQIKWYFGYEVNSNGETTYLPLIHASDSLKKAWIAVIDKLGPNGDGPLGNILDMKDAIATGSGDFRANKDTSIGLKMNIEDFFNAIKITIDESITGKYTYSTGKNMYGIIDGQKEYAQRLQKFYGLFESYYKEYSK